MTKNDTGTLCVRFIPDINDAYPLSIIVVDDRNNQTYLQVRQDEIDPLIACLRLPSSPEVRLVTMTFDCVVKWWSKCEVAFLHYKKRTASVLTDKEAMELSEMIKKEMFCSVCTLDPLSGANKRRDENLRGVFN